MILAKRSPVKKRFVFGIVVFAVVTLISAGCGGSSALPEPAAADRESQVQPAKSGQSTSGKQVVKTKPDMPRDISNQPQNRPGNEPEPGTNKSQTTGSGIQSPSLKPGTANTDRQSDKPGGDAPRIVPGRMVSGGYEEIRIFRSEKDQFVKVIAVAAEDQDLQVILELIDENGRSLGVHLEQGIRIPKDGEYQLLSVSEGQKTGDYTLEVIGIQEFECVACNLEQAGDSEISDDSPAAELNLDYTCRRPFYDKKPVPVDSDSNHSYYEYYWQENPKLCLTIYEPELIEDEWEERMTGVLEFGASTLGQIVPIDATLVDQKNSSPETLRTVSLADCSRGSGELDPTNLADCANQADPWGERFAAAGQSWESLHNGGDLAVFRDLWENPDNDPLSAAKAIKVTLHEYYHVYQHSQKLYFEEKKQFGIPLAWEKNPGQFHKFPPTKPIEFPEWIGEGGADFAGITLTARFDPSLDVRGIFENSLDEARAVISVAASKGDTVSLKDYEYQTWLYESSDNPNNGIPRNFAYHYTGGSWALMYLWSLDDDNYRKIMIDYYKNWAENENRYPGQSWKYSFESLFDMTLDDFYRDFDAFMRQDKASQMAILKTNEEMRNAKLAP